MKFSSFEELKSYIKEKEEREFIKCLISDSRTIQSTRNRVKRFLKDELVYYQVQFKCILSGFIKSQSKGYQPNQSTYKQNCPFVMKFRASADGTTLDLVSSVDKHNHDRNKEIYSLLPRQRQLDTKSREIVHHKRKLRVKKKLLPNKMVSLKDLHNLNSKEDSEDTLENALKYLQSENGNIVEIEVQTDTESLGQQEELTAQTSEAINSIDETLSIDPLPRSIPKNTNKRRPVDNITDEAYSQMKEMGKNLKNSVKMEGGVFEIMGEKLNSTWYHVNDGYFYTAAHSDKNRMYLKCKVPKCKGRASMSLRTDEKRLETFRITKSHCHDPDFHQQTLLELRRKILERCSNEVTPYLTIWNEEIARIDVQSMTELAGRITFNSLRSAMYRARTSKHPSTVESAEGEVSEIFVSPEFVQLLPGVEELHLDGTVKEVQTDTESLGQQEELTAQTSEAIDETLSIDPLPKTKYLRRSIPKNTNKEELTAQTSTEAIDSIDETLSIDPLPKTKYLRRSIAKNTNKRCCVDNNTEEAYSVMKEIGKNSKIKDEFDILGEFVAYELRKCSDKRFVALAKRRITDILHEVEMHELNMQSQSNANCSSSLSLHNYSCKNDE